jgi:hypothetical protein
LTDSLRRKDREREREKDIAGATLASQGIARRKGQDGAYDGRAGQRDQGRTARLPFELDLDNATLIGRRHNRGGGGLTKSPLAQDTLFGVHRDTIDAPQSPMHL